MPLNHSKFSRPVQRQAVKRTTRRNTMAMAREATRATYAAREIVDPAVDRAKERRATGRALKKAQAPDTREARQKRLDRAQKPDTRRARQRRLDTFQTTMGPGG